MNSLVKTFSIVALLFLFPFFGFSQGSPEPASDPITITITLIVDTENFDPNDLDKSCHFEVKRSDGLKVPLQTGVKLIDFLVKGKVDDEIIWQARPKPGSIGKVNIKKIRYQNGTRIFRKKDHGWFLSKRIKVKALYNSKGRPDYKYDLRFKIKKAGKANGKYTIDPKMKIMPR
ncbi:hypothetical protein [Algibacter mikhailovii]|uniref:hypothetical protein n=1 Tax=Algibacter mikhailovii TaxID=425498 RepID=UPI0024944888|nr:hypothetical protein [Algibacter mikhailovii]